MKRSWGAALALLFAFGRSRHEPAGSAARDSRTVDERGVRDALASAASPTPSVPGTRLSAEERTWVFESTPSGGWWRWWCCPSASRASAGPCCSRFTGAARRSRGPIAERAAGSTTMR